MKEQAPLSDKELNEIFDLTTGYTSGTLSQGELARLDELIRTSPVARERIAVALHDHGCIYDAFLGDSSSNEESDLLKFEAEPAPAASGFNWSRLTAVAALLMLCALVVQLFTNRENETPTFATLSQTDAASWGASSLSTVAGTRLGEGSLSLSEGLASIYFDSGVRLDLEGPAEILLHHKMSASLVSGTITAEVEPSGRGFELLTPSAKVIDHGTRFAVRVDPETAIAETKVFDGHVELKPIDDREEESVQLLTGQGAVSTSESLGSAGTTSFEDEWQTFDSDASQMPADLSINTGAGAGTDAFISTAQGESSGVGSLLYMKNGVNGSHRKSYLSFDLATVDTREIESCTLVLNFVNTRRGLVSHLPDSEFQVYGIKSSRLDEWSADQLRWDNAPANPVESDGGLIDTDQATLLGSFTMKRGKVDGKIEFTSPSLTSFLNNDKNQLASLIILRKTKELQTSGYVHGMASHRHPYLPGPTLVIDLK